MLPMREGPFNVHLTNAFVHDSILGQCCHLTKREAYQSLLPLLGRHLSSRKSYLLLRYHGLGLDFPHQL